MVRQLTGISLKKMIYEVKDGDFVKLPKKLKMNGTNFDIIGIQEDQLLFADSDHYYIDGKLLLEKEKWVKEARAQTIFIEHNDLEKMRSKFYKYFSKDLPEPRFYAGKEIVEMEIVEEDS